MECVILIAMLMFLDRFPAWILTVCGMVALALPIVCYLTVVADPVVYRSWLDVGDQFRRFMVTGVRVLRASLSIDTIRKGLGLLRGMKICPTTSDDWFAFFLFPFKVYVVVAIPFVWSFLAVNSLFSVAPGRMLQFGVYILTCECYILCLLVLLTGALLQALFSKRGYSAQTILLFVLGVMMMLGYQHG